MQWKDGDVVILHERVRTVQRIGLSSVRPEGYSINGM